MFFLSVNLQEYWITDLCFVSCPSLSLTHSLSLSPSPAPSLSPSLSFSLSLFLSLSPLLSPPLLLVTNCLFPFLLPRMTGYSPFQGETHQETFLNVTMCDYDFDDEMFDIVSQEAKDFIEKLLIKVPRYGSMAVWQASLQICDKKTSSRY